MVPFAQQNASLEKLVLFLEIVTLAFVLAELAKLLRVLTTLKMDQKPIRIAEQLALLAETEKGVPVRLIVPAKFVTTMFALHQIVLTP